MRVSMVCGLRLCAVVVLWSAAGHTAGGQAAEDNLVQNPGFEAGLASWSVQSWPADRLDLKADVSLDRQTRHAGDAAFRLTVDFPENAEIYTPAQTVPVFADMEYMLSAFIKTDLASGSIQLELQDARGWQLLSSASPPLSGRQDWTRVELPFRTGRATEAIRLSLRHVGRPGDRQPMRGDIWLDDVALREKPTGRPRLSARELEAAIRDSRLITLENDAVRIAFTEPRLCVRSIKYRQLPALQLSPDPLAEAPLYQITLRGPGGRSQEVRATDALAVTARAHGDQRPRRWVLEARHGGPLDRVSVQVELDESGAVDLRLETGQPQSGWTISDLVFPQIVTRGLLSDTPWNTFVGGAEPRALAAGWNLPSGTYPVSVRIPLLYQSGPHGGMYLMVRDPDQWVKAFRMAPQLDAAEKTPASITWQVAVELGAGDPLPRFTARLGPIQDTPYEAAEAYRDWAVSQAWCPPPLSARRDMTPWRLRGVPHYFYYQSQAHSDADRERSDQAPARTIEDLQKAGLSQLTLQDVPVVMAALPQELRELGGAVDLRGWEKWGLWMNPDWWPPREGEPALRQAIEAVHKAGLHVTTDIQFNQLSIHRAVHDHGGFGEEGLRAIEAHGIRVSDVGIMNGQGEVPWTGPPEYRSNLVCENVPVIFNHVVETLQHMRGAGFDEVQFDTGGWTIDRPCWNPKHLHPPGPGYWQTADSRDYYDRLRDAVSDAAPDAFGFCEEYYNELRLHSYATIYVRYAQELMPSNFTAKQARERFIDGRVTLQPDMFSYVYHDRVVESGFFWTAGPTEYQAAVNIVMGVCAGPQATPWLSFQTMLEDRWMKIFLAGTRARETFARPYLLLGQMLRPMQVEPWVTISVERREVGANAPVRETYQVPAVVQQAYRAPDGKIGWILINHTNESVTCVPQPPQPPWFRQLAAARAIHRITVDGSQPLAPRDLANVTLAPAEVVMLEEN